MNATDPESAEVAEGLTIDVVKRLLATIKVPRCADNSSSEAVLSSPDAGDWESLMQITMLPGNPDIFNIIQSDECRPDLHPYRLCIGAAAISDRQRAQRLTLHHALISSAAIRVSSRAIRRRCQAASSARHSS